MDEWNKYFIEGTNVLKNKLGVNNRDELNELERKIVFKKINLFRNIANKR